MTDTELELPQGWVKQAFDLCISNIIGGDWGSPVKEEIDNDFVKVQVLRSTELKNWKMEKGSTAESRIIKKSSLEKRQLHNGDIILEVSGGGTKFPVGRSVLITTSIMDNFSVPIICSNFFRKITLSQFLDPMYASNFLDYYYGSGETIKFKNQSVNIQNLKTKEYLSALSIPIPPLNEQKRIVSKIEELFLNIDSAKQSLGHTKLKLDNYRDSLLKFAFEGKLTENWRQNNPTKNYVNAEFKNLPKTWKIVELQEISKIIDSLHVTPKYESEGIFMVRSTEIKFGNLNLKSALLVSKEIYEKFTRNYKPKRNDIVMSRVGTYFVTSFVNTDEIFCMGQNTLVIHPLINPKFLYNNLNSVFVEKQIQEKLVGSSGQKTISLKNIRGLLISLPPLEEQEQIVSQIEQGFSFIENTTQMVNSSLEKLQTMKTPIFKQAFGGKLVPQDHSDESAEKLLERIKVKKSKIL